MGRSWSDECAIMAVSLPPTRADALQLVYDGLRMQQHRGQDGSGMAYVDCSGVVALKKTGLVSEVYDADWLGRTACNAIGHNRYATQGAPSPINLQPQYAAYGMKSVYVVSNGDLTNYRELRAELEAQGARFVSDNDAECLAHILAQNLAQNDEPIEAICQVQARAVGAFSAAALIQGRIYVWRDKHGFRPLAFCHLPGRGVAVASETVAFDAIGGDMSTYQDVPANAIIELHRGGVFVHSRGHVALNPCVFEWIYFARPDSMVFGLPVSLIRRRIGWQLSRNFPMSTDGLVVVPVPDSATEIGRGVAEGLSLPIIGGLLRSHTARRTFIESDQVFRDEGVKYKFNPDRYLIDGQRVLLIDDSIVRGTTIRKIVRMVRHAGAAQVHLMVGSPPVRWPCFMGIATPTKEELIANRMSVEEIRTFAEADSLTYLTLDQLKAAIGPLQQWEREQFPNYLRPLLTADALSWRGRVRQRLGFNQPDQHCFACFTGDYPVPIPSS